MIIDPAYRVGERVAFTVSAAGHFETKSDAYRRASFGFILLQELTV
jgi:hypothetical protein